MDAFYWLGGVLPEGLEITADQLDEDETGECMIARVVEEDDLYLRDYVNTGIKNLQRIAEAHGLEPDELRLCFAYDC